MPDVFAAVSDPTRRLILGRLREEGESSLKTLARCLPMSRQAVTKHLDILVAAGLEQAAEDLGRYIGLLSGASPEIARTSNAIKAALASRASEVSRQVLRS